MSTSKLTPGKITETLCARVSVLHINYFISGYEVQKTHPYLEGVRDDGVHALPPFFTYLSYLFNCLLESHSFIKHFPT